MDGKKNSVKDWKIMQELRGGRLLVEQKNTLEHQSHKSVVIYFL